MKKLIAVLAILGGISSLGFANNVTDTVGDWVNPLDHSQGTVPGPVAGDILYYNGISGNSQGTWAPIQSVVQQYITNVPAATGVSANGTGFQTNGNIDFVGSGITSTPSSTPNTSEVNFSGFHNQQMDDATAGVATNAQAISDETTRATNAESLLDGRVTQNTSDISSLNTTVADHSTHLTSIDNHLTSVDSTLVDHSTHLTNLDNGLAAE